MRFALYVVLAGLPCAAQFEDLATTGDGSELYFSSRFIQPQVEGQALHRKIFRWSADGFELVAQRERFGPGVFANFYELVSPDVSGDGSVVTATAFRACNGGSRCISVPTEAPAVIRGANPLQGLGGLQVSRSGRFLLLRGSQIERFDQTTQERTLFPGQARWVAAKRQAITSDGRVLLRGTNLLGLWDGDSIAEIRLEATPVQAIVSDDGTRFLFTLRDDSNQSALWTVNADGTDLRRLTETSTPAPQPAISNDGRTGVYVANRRIHVADLVLGTERVLDEPSDFVTTATVSGNGEIVFAATSLNELWRIDLVSESATRLAERTVSVDETFGAPVPGSLQWLRGSGLADALITAEPPYPRSLGGVELEVGGVQAAIVAVSPEQIVYQIPWEAELGSTAVRFSASDSPFQAAREAPLTERWINVVQFGREAYAPGIASGTLVLDQDFQRLITEDEPARPGDVVHVYATGLGSTVGAPTTGEPTPASPLPWLMDPLDCFYLQDFERKPAELLYAGLAPGLVGLYQVSFRVPLDFRPLAASPRHDVFELFCEDALSERFSVPLQFPADPTSSLLRRPRPPGASAR